MTKTYNIVGKRKIYYIISISIILIAFLFTAIFGVKLDIQFKGGTLISYSFAGDIDTSKIASAASSVVGQEVTATKGSSISDNSQYVQLSFSSSKGLTSDLQSKLTETLKTDFSQNNLSLLSSTDVNPALGQSFFLKCLVAFIFACIVLIVYIALRFSRINGLSSGVMAIIALLHDVLIVYATFVIFRIPIDANFMAVALTILGYSMNDTVVIYDRIRENKKIYGSKMPMEELVNTSINQSLSRSINTSLSTIMAMVVVSIVALIFGVDSILSFSFPLTIGMVTGVYSTICIAGPLMVDWQSYKDKHKPSYADKKKRR